LRPDLNYSDALEPRADQLFHLDGFQTADALARRGMPNDQIQAMLAVCWNRGTGAANTLTYLDST